MSKFLIFLYNNINDIIFLSLIVKLFTTIDKQMKLILDLPPMMTKPVQFTANYIDDIKFNNDTFKYYMIWTPIKLHKHSNAELLAMPEVRIIRESMISQPGFVKYKIIDGMYLSQKQ